MCLYGLLELYINPERDLWRRADKVWTTRNLTNLEDLTEHH